MMSEPKRDLMRRVHFVRDAEYSERGPGAQQRGGRAIKMRWGRLANIEQPVRLHGNFITTRISLRVLRSIKSDV